jgi:hypothetical protein
MDRREEPAHVLKLDMLLLILQSHQQTCRLRAEVPAGIMATATHRLGKGKIQAHCQAELVVVQGQVQSCFIRERQKGQLMFQEQVAFELLQQCGVLRWSMLREPDILAQLALSLNVEESPDNRQTEKAQPLYPRRAAYLEQGQLANLPRKYRQVLNLVNGQREINELCHLLHCSRKQLMEILVDLAANRLIKMSDDDDDSGTRNK